MMMGGHVPVAPYATFGTEQLAENIREELSDKADSILLQNHGLVTTGKNLSAAYEKAVQLEFSCKIYLIASSCGKPRILSEEEMQDCAERRKELFTYRAAFKPVDKLKEYVGD
jgi:L-fuculose-phosphate aldolase